MELDSRHSVRRFVLPVTLENIGTVLIGLVFSWLVGGISRSALAAIGLNTSLNDMKKAGIRPMIHGFIISALVVIVALVVEICMGLV